MVPDQKLQLIRALKANGEVGAITGDGVNDAPALRAADIGIAMGARGTDVARESAALVVTDDDFASIAGGVRQGRASSTTSARRSTPSSRTNPPGTGRAHVRPQGAHDRRPARASVLLGVLGVYLWTVLDGRPDDVVRSVTFAALVVGNLALILVNRSWRRSIRQTIRQRRNRTVEWILGAAGTLLVTLVSAPWLRAAFNFGPMRPSDWLAALAAGFIGVAWFEAYKARARRRPSSTS